MRKPKPRKAKSLTEDARYKTWSLDYLLGLSDSEHKRRAAWLPSELLRDADPPQASKD